MNRFKKKIKRICETIKGKPVYQLTVGVEIKNCDKCEYKKMACAGCSIQETLLRIDDEIAPLRIQLGSYQQPEGSANK